MESEGIGVQDSRNEIDRLAIRGLRSSGVYNSIRDHMREHALTDVGELIGWPKLNTVLI